MIFLYPSTIFIMLIPLMILSFFILTNSSKINILFSKEMLEKLTINSKYHSKYKKYILILLALVLIIISLARPVIIKQNIALKQELPSITIALDISNSMLATDIYPDRLTFAKKKIIELLDGFKTLNASVYAFSSNIFLISPKTNDIETIKFIISHLHIKQTEQKSTSFTNILHHLKNEKNIVIFTDGGENNNFFDELKLIDKYNQKVYIYSIATDEGGPIKIDGSYLLNTNNNIVISKLNKKISQLSIESNAIYTNYSYETNSTINIVNSIKKSNYKLDNFDLIDKDELFKYPLFLAIILIFLAFYSIKKDDKLQP